jgi:hypothetical protein
MSTDENKPSDTRPAPPPSETRPAPPPGETRPAHHPQAEEKAITGSGVLDAALAFGAVGGGVGGIAQAAHVAKHWNDPSSQAPTPQASAEPAPAAKAPAPEPPAE